MLCSCYVIGWSMPNILKTIFKTRIHWKSGDRPEINFNRAAPACLFVVETSLKHRINLYNLTSPVYIVAYAISAGSAHVGSIYFDFEKRVVAGPESKGFSNL